MRSSKNSWKKSGKDSNSSRRNIRDHSGRDSRLIRDTRPQVLVIVGPTASGKSALAIKLAKRLNGEVISADSRQVYVGMDIGTGKVTRDHAARPNVQRMKANEKRMRVFAKNSISFGRDSSEYFSRGIRHHLLNVADPRKVRFTADDFVRLGRKALDDIITRGKTPIICGGTGFYIDALLGRVKLANVPPNPKLRKRFDKLSAEHLFKMLRKLDPRRAKTIDRHNKRRLIRALEIAMAAKQPELRTQDLGPSEKYKIIWLGIGAPKVELKKRIKKRLDERLRQGMIEEVIRLKSGVRPHFGLSWKRLDELGLEYRWISRWLRQRQSKVHQVRNVKEFTESEEYENLLRDVIRYSKRQMTWFKRNENIQWIKPTTNIRVQV